MRRILDAMNPLRIEIGDDQDGSRLDAVVAKASGSSRSAATELVSAGAVTVDGRVEPKSYRVAAGEIVEVSARLPERVDPPALPPIVYEDENLLVLDKPAGMVVHPAPGLKEGTLVDALRASGRPLAARAGADRPGIVHRLDRDVSGLLVVAKTDAAHEALVRAIAERRMRREYLALVAGDPAVDTGKVDAPIGRHPRQRSRMAVIPDGKPAVTWFAVRERFGETALLEVRLETGRTHQIRVHLASIGHPVVGDATYGRHPGLARDLGLTRPFLHAFRLSVPHPADGAELALSSPLPGDLRVAHTKLGTG